MAAFRHRPGRHSGLTLAEMLVTVAVLAVAASIAVPLADPLSPFAAEAAAGEVARALRFAQREAVRTNAWHKVSFDTSAQSLQVLRLTTSGAADPDPAKTVLHPLEKRAYQASFSSGGARAVLASALFRYDDNTTGSAISFDPGGTPADIRGAASKDIYPLKDGKIVITQGNTRREVVLEPETGRVTF